MKDEVKLFREGGKKRDEQRVGWISCRGEFFCVWKVFVCGVQSGRKFTPLTLELRNLWTWFLEPKKMLPPLPSGTLRFLKSKTRVLSLIVSYIIYIRFRRQGFRYCDRLLAQLKRIRSLRNDSGTYA